MARFLFWCLFFSAPLIAIAQQNRFIYIQTENRQAFYVKIDKKVYSSTASGYVIIPQLKEGSYNLSVGFPKNEWPEQAINCKVGKTDQGYMLKNFMEKGWGLFNLQTMDILMPGTVTAITASTENKKDEFSNMLANAVNDSSIRKTEVVKQVQKKEEPSQPVTQIKNEQPVQSSAKSISRLLYLNGKEGVQMVFSDMIDGKTDTIRLLIPAEKNDKAVTTPVKEEVVKAEPLKKEEISPAVKEPVPPAKEKFIDIELPNPNAKQPNKPVIAGEPATTVVADNPQPVAPAPTEVKKVTMINSNCKNYAVEEDFLKLRKKMAAEENEDDMVATARKTFKTKCFNVDQIKNLAVLFLKDEGRYKFFDAAYPFVSDSENFSSLRGQLTDEYYIIRFNAMVRH